MQEIQRRKYETDEEKAALVPQLRNVSRQEYLKKREGQKLQALDDELRDEEYLFACAPLPPCCCRPCAKKRFPLHQEWHHCGGCRSRGAGTHQILCPCHSAAPTNRIICYRCANKNTTSYRAWHCAFICSKCSKNNDGDT